MDEIAEARALQTTLRLEDIHPNAISNEEEQLKMQLDAAKACADSTWRSCARFGDSLVSYKQNIEDTAQPQTSLLDVCPRTNDRCPADAANSFNEQSVNLFNVPTEEAILSACLSAN